jgi:hypothetical protein
MSSVPSTPGASNPAGGRPRDVQSLIWGAKGPNYQAPFDEVLSALTGAIAEHYRAREWDPWTAFKHSWYFARDAGLQAWAKVEAGLWLPFQPTFTLKEFNKKVLVGRLRRSVGAALSDPGLMTFWTEAALEKGGQTFSLELAKEMRLKAPELNVVHHTFALFWDRHTPPMEFWAYGPMAVMLEHVLRSKGLSVSLSEGNLRILTSRLRLRKSEHVIVRWSPSEGPGILNFDVDAARAVGLPSGSERGLD